MLTYAYQRNMVNIIISSKFTTLILDLCLHHISTLQNIFPFEIISNKAPNYLNLKSFGCLHFTWLKPQTKSQTRVLLQTLCILRISTKSQWIQMSTSFDKQTILFQACSLCRRSVPIYMSLLTSTPSHMDTQPSHLSPHNSHETPHYFVHFCVPIPYNHIHHKLSNINRPTPLRNIT